ncbi:hypothetical protein NF634_004558 [Salmonella enterica]|nr:hypothetical protein [Salmonella enterica]
MVNAGKDTHHAVAINFSGKRLLKRTSLNDKNKLYSLISELKQYGQILLIVYQPAIIGVFPVVAARSEASLSDTSTGWKYAASPKLSIPDLTHYAH